MTARLHRDQLLAQIKAAADLYRETDEELQAAETEARRVGLPEEDIRDAKNLWLR